MNDSLAECPTTRADLGGNIEFQVPLIAFECSDFPNPKRNGIFERDVPWPELVWAAVTVGKWRDDFGARGRYSTFEVLHRAASLWAYLKTSDTGRYMRTAAYHDLDATEKASVSYLIGMTTTKVFADLFLNTPWLMHLDRYRQAYGIALKPGRTRPDLVGPSSTSTMTDWLVAEAKGRTNAVRDYDVDHMAQQKQRVVSIGGAPPETTFGLAAHFATGELEARVVDPPSSGPDAPELFSRFSRDPTVFSSAYFGPLIALLGDVTADESGLWMYPLPYCDLEVGLEGDAPSAPRVAPGIWERRPSRQVPDQGLFVGSDGVAVRLGKSWDSDAMRLDPADRR
jgi:hypothetical protein